MGLFGGSDDVLPYVEELVASAEGSTVTADRLTAPRLNDTVLVRLDEGEQPHHLLVAEETPLRVNERGSISTVAPADDRTVVTVLTDRRIHFLVGCESGDAVYGVEYGDVHEFEVGTKLLRARLVVTCRDERYTAAFSRFVDTGAVAAFLERKTATVADVGTADAPEAAGDSEGGADPEAAGGPSAAEEIPSEAIERALRSIDDHQFERFVADLWRARGWATTVTRQSGDRGIDVVATRDELLPQKHVVQAKRYAADNPVGSPEIQQYASLDRQEDGVDAVVVVTTSTFTRQAERIARELNVKLVDGADLAGMIAAEGRHDLLAAHGATLPEADVGRSTNGPAGDQSETVRDRNGDERSSATAADPSASRGGDGRTTRARKGPESDGGHQVDAGSAAADGSKAPISVEDEPVIRSTGDDRGTYGSRRGHAVVALLTAWWTLGLGNLAYASWAYHHATSPRLDAEEIEAPPSENWFYGIPAGVVIAASSALVGAAGFATVGVAGLFAGWLLLLSSTYFDVQRVRAETVWNPVTGWWLLGVTVLPLAALTVPAYLLKRSLATGSLTVGGILGDDDTG